MSNQNKDSNPQNPSSTDTVSALRKMLQYWWLFLLSFVVCFGMAYLYIKFKAPVYLIESSIMVDDELGSSASSKMVSTSSALRNMMGGSNMNVNNEVLVMNSETLMSRMVSELGINCQYFEKTGFLKKKDRYNDSPIEVTAPKELFDTLSVSLHFKIHVAKDGKAHVKVLKGLFKTMSEVKNVTLPCNVKTPYGIFSVQPTRYFVPHRDYQMNAYVSGYIPCSEALRDGILDVLVMTKKSDAIWLKVEDTNPQRGRDMLNTLMRLYNEKGLKDKDEQAMNTAKFIDERLALIYKDLMGSEAEIESYKKAHNMVDPELQVKESVVKQSASEQAIIALETQYRIVSMIQEFLANPANKRSLIPFEADSTTAIASIRAYNRLITERMRLETSAKENNQALQSIDQQIAAMRTNVARGINSSLTALRIKMGKAQAQNSSATGKMSQMPTQERETRILYREQGIQNELYIFLLQKREENALRLAGNVPKGKIIDKAYAHSKPLEPKMSMVAFVALLFALALPFLILYLKKMLNTKFEDQDELEEISDVPVVGHVHHNRHNRTLVVTPTSTSSIVELFRYMRNNVQFMMPNQDDKVVLVTSSTSGEGKSFVSANLAASFALLDERVVIVGMDIRRPQLAESFGLNAVPGVTGYLAKSDLTIDDIIQRSQDIENLDVIVAGAIPPNPGELLLGKRTAQLFEELRARYDIIIIDSAPVAQVSDSFSLTKFADATIYVTRAGVTKRNMVKFMNRLVAEKRLTNVGTVINDTKISKHNTYGYGYGEQTVD